MEFYLGSIRFRPNTKWFEIYKLIKANSKEEAEKKLKSWVSKNIPNGDNIVYIEETI